MNLFLSSGKVSCTIVLFRTVHHFCFLVISFEPMQKWVRLEASKKSRYKFSNIFWQTIILHFSLKLKKPNNTDSYITCEPLDKKCQMILILITEICYIGKKIPLPQTRIPIPYETPPWYHNSQLWDDQFLVAYIYLYQYNYIGGPWGDPGCIAGA